MGPLDEEDGLLEGYSAYEFDSNRSLGSGSINDSEMEDFEMGSNFEENENKLLQQEPKRAPIRNQANAMTLFAQIMRDPKNIVSIIIKNKLHEAINKKISSRTLKLIMLGFSVLLAA
eukprot:CAMPEP_0202964346 /NCGR_PEP_ID=MMETSP1396-20130829/8424_1 /ASSEMBLY_ACC=CAM_ASM_000872 /TAXON_ID= /ORGANISM="Pseudokeronopsis sp., Strain Brazil" /LENGTH=116 /DNA_ID=CAMNT_0049686375 /DNA_START=1313 /DNA_END=1663 /DNA_ORIENTATION=+